MNLRIKTMCKADAKAYPGCTLDCTIQIITVTKNLFSPETQCAFLQCPLVSYTKTTI